MTPPDIRTPRSKIDFINFNGAAAGIAMTILSAALLWWLSAYFVSIKQYEKDQSAMQSTLKEIKDDVKEGRNDIKELLRKK